MSVEDQDESDRARARARLLMHRTVCPAGSCDICDDRRDAVWEYRKENQ